MNYVTIQPPFTLRFREMSRAELRDYFTWFQQIMPLRMVELLRAVRLSPGFETWEPDLTPTSLDRLGERFAGNVEVRPRTDTEIREIGERATFSIEISGEELTNRTFSLAMDAGMYLGQVFLRQHPILRWDQELRSKKNADYGQPVLAGFSSTALNPVRLLVTLAYGIASKERSGRKLRDLYNTWAQLIPSQ